jgi:hypothetical protein
MLKQILQALVIVPLYGVPIALVAWAIFQVAVRKAPLKAFAGLLVGTALCGAALVMFIASIYCENCAERAPSLRDVVIAGSYFAFGVAMFVAMWLTARPSKGPRADGAAHTET